VTHYVCSALRPVVDVDMSLASGWPRWGRYREYGSRPAKVRNRCRTDFQSAVVDYLLRVCAVKRRRFPVGARPTRQPLQPEATGAVMEVTKSLKPSGNRSHFCDSACVQAATRVNAEQASRDWATYQLQRVFKSCRWRCTRRRSKDAVGRVGRHTASAAVATAATSLNSRDTRAPGRTSGPRIPPS
jgi:hypothetical protein